MLSSIGLLSILQASGQGTSAGNQGDTIDLLPDQLVKTYDFTVPPRPSGHVLDLAGFLQGNMLEKINAELAEASRDCGIEIYLLIVTSLKKDTLLPFTKEVCSAWTKGTFGAAIVFDDETGRVAIERSEVVAKRYYEFELSKLLKDRMNPEKRPRLSRDGLAYTTNSLRDAICVLKRRADDEDRRAHIKQVVLLVVLICGSLVVFYLFRRKLVLGSDSTV